MSTYSENSIYPTRETARLSRWNFQNTLTSEFIEAVLDETYEEQFRKAHEKENADEEETPTC
jgi:hypothetical protein